MASNFSTQKVMFAIYALYYLQYHQTDAKQSGCSWAIPLSNAYWMIRWVGWGAASDPTLDDPVLFFRLVKLSNLTYSKLLTKQINIT